MKNSIKLLCVGAMGCLLMTGCSEEQLETSPTTSMSGTSLMANGNAALVPLNGIYRSMYTAGWSTTDNTHQCFGISAYNLMADVMGEDMVMAAQGSGWFWYDCIYNVKSRFTSSTWRSYDLWNAYYTWISNANYILAAEETMEGTSLERGYALGQAYAIRAYSYYMLAQSFARTYKGHENELCCPIYKEPTTASTKGQPRSTVQDVYKLIVEDMGKAVSYLNGTTRKHISHIGYDVALGLQARIALTMEDWNTAKTAAHAAIEATSAKITKVADFAGVNSVSHKNVMWGAEVIADQSGMYAGFFTHMDASAGKYGSTAQKRINAELYSRISSTDDRKAWWDADNNLQQEKFKFSDLATWLGDYIWMRVEEMYLIAAEAECRLGATEEEAAKSDLMALMSKRDAAYTCNKTGAELGATTDEWTNSLLEEILVQRRIELWGEAGRVYDIRRLKQGFKRTSAMGWPAAALLAGRPTDDPENYMWVLTIPQSEFDGNENMSLENDQNPTDDK